MGALLLVSMALPWLWTPVEAHEEVIAEFFEGVETLLIPSVSTGTVVVDGVIGTDEYNEFGHWADEEEGVELYMEHDGDLLYLAVVNGLGGWVAVGLGLNESASFDVKVAGSNGTSAKAEDRFISVLTDELSAVPDMSQGGTSDIVGFAASSEGADSVFEFRIPLVSDDTRDTPLEPGRLRFGFAAFGNETSVPDDLQGAEVHFFRVYTLRMTEDPDQIRELFEGRAPPGPVPTVATIAVASLGVVGLLWRLMGGRGGGKG
jgi:hypothetical protein